MKTSTFCLRPVRIGVLALIPLATLTFSPSLQAAKHERNWQTGTLLDAQRSRVYLGTYSNTSTNGNATAYGNSATYSGSSTTTQQARYGQQEVEVVDGGDKIYVVERLLKWRWSREANLTANAPIKFVIEGRNMYLLDDDGREYKTKVIKKTLK